MLCIYTAVCVTLSIVHEKSADLFSPNIIRLMLCKCSKWWHQIRTPWSAYTDTCQTVEPSPETNPLSQLWENKVTDVFLGLFPKRKCECVRDRDRKNGGPQHSHSNLNHRNISWDFLAVQNFSGHWSLINANKRLKRVYKEEWKEGKRRKALLYHNLVIFDYRSTLSTCFLYVQVEQIQFKWNIIKAW